MITAIAKLQHCSWIMPKRQSWAKKYPVRSTIVVRWAVAVGLVTTSL